MSLSLISHDTFPVADRDSERHLKKFFKKLIRKKGIEDALNKLDILTQEEVNMATVQILKISRHIKGGVEAVRVEIKGVGDNDNHLIEGTFTTLAIHHVSNQKSTRWQGNERSYGRREALVAL